MKIFLKTDAEIELMRKANHLVGLTLGELGKFIKPGVTTYQLDQIAERFIIDHGAVPTFRNYPNPFGGSFPSSICTSVNDVVAHGIPSRDVVLKEGDIVSIDCGVLLNGYNGDSCYTFGVGSVADSVKDLMQTTKESLYRGIKQAVSGHHVGDIGFAIQQFCEKKGFGIVRQLTGHGIGRQMHEAPQIPNYGSEGSGVLLKKGMCIAIEPMVTQGSPLVWLLPDKWGVITRDRKPAAHYEHTLAITDGEAEVLSTFEEIES